ncbi:hypothetical protein PENTCL1PPCAC_18931 [Pristionchus entomophagus]|uniref:Uncharacterized protein n=1 Tax=Pristionchus entomophagus TaxID=358040 RepID=A0AAV5TR07_9BILA|nr:hypothetical protein PENTCL1PPCAC_18931 [Pristionchus entomophagus]
MRRSEDGLLLRKKQEQWAKEKEEQKADNWFPFGSPGGGNPNKKHVARDYEAAALKSPQPYARPAAENVPPPQDPSTSGRPDTVAARVASFEEAGNNMSASYSGAPSAPLPYLPHHHPMMYATATGAAGGGGGGSMQPMDYMQQFHYAPMPAAYHPAYHPGYHGGVPEGAASAPGYAPYSRSHHHHYTPHMIPVHVLPAGTIPIPVPPPQNAMTSSYSTEQWVGEWTNPHHKMMSSGGTTIEELSEDASSTVEGAVLPVEQHAHITTTAVCTMQHPQQPYASLPFPASAAAVATVQQPQSLYDLPHAYVSPFVAAGGGSAQQTASDEKSENEYDGYKAQILERQRLEAEKEEREKREEEGIERVRREMEETRRREDEKKEGEERRREEERQRSAQAVLEAMERAKKEAEMLKKMRLHRHTLDAVGGGAPIEGVDRGRVEEIKKEVDLLERHKRLEAEEIARNAPPKEKKRGMSLSRSPSIAAHYEADERPRSRAAPPAPPTPPASPFCRAASLAPASAAARRILQTAATAAAASPRQPLATSTPQQPFERDAKMRFSLRGTPSPVGITSRYAHLNRPQSPSSRGSSPSTMTTPVRSPSVGRPPFGPPSRSKTQLNCTPSMPSRDSPLSRTFHAGDKTRQSMKDNARSSGYGIGGDFLYSYSPSASRSATPDRMGWSSSGRTEAIPEPHQQRRGREEERRREWREGSYEDGGSSPRSNDTYITSPTVTATSRVEEPVIRYSAPREEYGRPRSSSVRPASRQEELDEYGRRSNIPVPLPRTRFTPPSPVNSSVTNPLFSPISTRARKMRISSKDTPTYRRENSMESSVTSNDSGASSGSEERGEMRGGQGGTQEGFRKITAKERVVPAIKVNHSEEETDEAPVKMFTPRFSSRPSTPSGADRVNGGLRHYSERVREMGTANADRLREPLTPQVQPRQSSLEPSSSLSASLRNLRMSINNLNIAGLGAEASSPDSSGRGPAPSGAASVGASPLLAAGADSPGLTRFHSRTSQYRSFNTKRGTERQQQLLDRLVSLRSRLQDTQSYKDRPLSRQGSTLSISGAGVSRLAASP